MVQIGSNGIQRGGLGDGDTNSQRYYCPFTDLTKCVAAGSSVVLTAESERPCRPGRSPVVASATAGLDLPIVWAGNGHTGQWNGTCVSISIAPYANDPSPSDFTNLESCLDFAVGETPAGKVTLPASLKEGEYTLFWLWPFSGFYYSSCADIWVTASSGGTSPPSTAISVETAKGMPYSSVDCSNVIDSDGYCKAVAAPTSYCVNWLKDSCGFSHCQGLITDSTCASLTQVTETTASPTTLEMSTANVTETLPTIQATAVFNVACNKQSNPDAYCQLKFGSYCKTDQLDSCGRALCQGEAEITAPC